MYSNKKGKTWPKGDECFYAHTFNELREPDAPILISVKRKVDKAFATQKCDQIHLTKEMEEDYKQIKSKYNQEKLKIEELKLEIDKLQKEKNEMVKYCKNINRKF